MRGCPMPGCPELTRHPDGCPEHRYRVGHAQVYDAQWEAFAATYRSTHPRCELCRRRRSREVDHIIPVRVAPHRRLDPTNVRALCSPCHVTITAATRAHTERRPRHRRG